MEGGVFLPKYTTYPNLDYVGTGRGMTIGYVSVGHSY
jgi:hypothetical protein